MEFLPSVSTQFILDEIAGNPDIDTNQSRDSREPPHASQPALVRNQPAKRSIDAPLRKSLSDPTALIARSGLQSRPSLMRNALSTVPEQEQEIEQGPWTSEALDLFDFWPPGRAKPC